MKILPLFLSIFFVSKSYSQNPESGYWWSLQYQNKKVIIDSLDKIKILDDMGWTETASGRYAFQFSEEKVIFYVDGFMGEDYKLRKNYSVLNRTPMIINGDFAKYTYDTVDEKGNPVRFIVKVKNESPYDIALINMLDKTDERGKYKAITEYGCSREYKTIN